MDITFHCSKCNQELAVDESAAGQEIQCPTCNEVLTIPEKSVAKLAATPSAPAVAAAPAGHAEKHFAVPQREGPGEILLKKKDPALAADAGVVKAKKIRTHCIKHFSCVEVGRDKYDDVVTEFLQKIGEENLVSINAINYDVVDSIGRTLSDYGVMIVYHG